MGIEGTASNEDDLYVTLRICRGKGGKPWNIAVATTWYKSTIAPTADDIPTLNIANIIQQQTWFFLDIFRVVFHRVSGTDESAFISGAALFLINAAQHASDIFGAREIGADSFSVIGASTSAEILHHGSFVQITERHQIQRGKLVVACKKLQTVMNDDDE